jgi:TonB-dependent SusC/RagA subfamily outer membrane receptor
MLSKVMRHAKRVASSLFLAYVLCPRLEPAVAQEPDTGLPIAAAPRFFALAEAGPRTSAAAWRDAADDAVFRQRIALDLNEIPLEHALAEIGRRASLRLTYSPVLLRRIGAVTLNAADITVGAALSAVLYDAGVDVLLVSRGQAALVKRGDVEQQPVTVRGRVTEGTPDGAGILGVTVTIVGTRLSGITNADGMYRINRVPAGNRQVRAERLGYRPETKSIPVITDSSITMDFALTTQPTPLAEVVVTATGPQRRIELGHVVGLIKADVLVREAPISTVTELLNARVPGLQVFQAQGTVGGDVRLQIRGVNSLALMTEPIVVVDGVRYSTTRTDGGSYLQAAEHTSRLNDLNPNDIESIEVVKGPSAATLYGTDASNGVLVINTKRGRPGSARLTSYARFTRMIVPTGRFPDNYWAWGSNTSQCTLTRVAAGNCAQDSIMRMPSPLNSSSTALVGAQGSFEYGANLSGGSNDLRYYVSGDITDETSPLQFPPALVEEMRQRLGGEFPKDRLNPNHVGKANLRANLHALLGPRGELQVTTGYTHNSTRMAVHGDGYRDAFTINNPTRTYDGMGAGLVSLFDQSSIEDVNRFNVGTTGHLRPIGWLVLRMNAGLDLTSANRYSIQPRLDVVRSGRVENSWTRGMTSTFDLGATATTRRDRLTLRSSVGAQYVRGRTDGTSTTGFGLPPGGGSVQEASSVITSQSFSETVTLGGYVEEVVGLNERLYLTGAVRADGASSFGRDYDAAIYPKSSVSWLATEEPFMPRIPGLDELRLRYAYGASGQQPTSDMGRAQLASFPTFENDLPGLGLATYSLPNPDLRPERVREHEFGFDANFLSNRFQLEATWYRRSTIDALRSINLPAGLSFQWVNIGLIRDRGFELQAALNLLDSRKVRWDLALRHATDEAQLVRIGAGRPRYSAGGGFAEGYPIGARFITPLLGFNDADGDGIIEVAELQLGTEPVYVGRSTPPRAQTLTSSLGLFDNRVRLSTLLERRSGFTQIDFNAVNNCTNANCLARLDPNTPLSEQARVLAFGRSATGFGDAPNSPIEKGDFIRLREASMSIDVPGSLLRGLGLGQATVTLAGRNLAIWKSFKGADPESTGGVEGPGHAYVTQGGIYGGRVGGLPQARVWTARLDVSF